MPPLIHDDIPAPLVETVTAMLGSRGREWLAELPGLVAKLETQWDLTCETPFSKGEYNFVAPATGTDGSQVVLKIGPPYEGGDIGHEAEFLRRRDGRGAVTLLAHDPELRALLLERAVPGVSLTNAFADDPRSAVAPAIGVLSNFVNDAVQAPHDAPTLDEWFGNFADRFAATDFPRTPAERSIEIYRRLSGDRSKERYLHGDLHLENIVSSGREPFLAIDPKGVIGHFGYDIAVFLVNFYRWNIRRPDLASLIDNAVGQYARAFGLTVRDVREWAFAQAVISEWWTFEDMPGSSRFDPAALGVWQI